MRQITGVELTRDEVATMILKASRNLGSQKALAEKVGCSGCYVSHVINGSKAPTQKMMEYVGVKKAYVYETNTKEKRA